jgi:membrane protein implicated in regulation of membrane protease activity
MKKVFILFLSLVIVISFAGCGVKDKIEAKVSEAVGEKVIEDLAGGKVDIDGDIVTVKSEDGTEATIGGTEWPKSNLIKNIPEFKAGTIVSVMDSESFTMVIMEEVKEEDYSNYLEGIKKDFTKDALEMNSDGVTLYTAGNGKGCMVQVSYELGNLHLTINASLVDE